MHLSPRGHFSVWRCELNNEVSTEGQNESYAFLLLFIIIISSSHRQYIFCFFLFSELHSTDMQNGYNACLFSAHSLLLNF